MTYMLNGKQYLDRVDQRRRLQRRAASRSNFRRRHDRLPDFQESDAISYDSQESDICSRLFAGAACCLRAACQPSRRAQSAIGGTVKDTSGAVLPGVTVEVASDVLIEKTKSVSTDGQGAYKIVDLRPGIYVMTFSLQGFNTFKREALELPSNFTVTSTPT